MSDVDPARIIQILDRHQVRYVVVGGYAAMPHGSSRPTVDMDIAPEMSHET